MDSQTKYLNISVHHKDGLHSRPITCFVYITNSFPDVEFVVTLKERSVNGKSLLGVLSLGVCEGAAIQIAATGPPDDVTCALSSLQTLINSNFAETTFKEISNLVSDGDNDDE